MPVYGADIEELAKKISWEAEEIELDWSVEAAYHLAWAFYCLTRLEKLGVILKAQNGVTQIVAPAIKQAWRELLYVRLHRVSPEIMANDISRRVTISKTGVIHESKDNFTISAYKRGIGASDIGTPGSVHKGKPRAEVAGRSLRVRARRTRQFSKSKNAGTRR
jgi:hypothetical protein